MKSKIYRRIQESDIDELGHVNYIVYIKLLTEARTEWIGELVGTVEGMTSKLKVAHPIVHMEITYAKETLLGDKLTVITEPNEIGNKSFSLKQKIYNKRDELVVEGVVKHVMFSLKNRTSIPVVPEIRNVFEKVKLDT